MGRNPLTILYVLLMVATIVAVDIAFFRHKFWWRLISNIAIVAVFVIIYFAFIRHK